MKQGRMSMLTKKVLLKRIEDLHVIYGNITNFDELYKKIMESYQTSKSLINEQILQYDKKIIQNNALIDSRLDDFRAKIDKAIDETFINNKKWLDEQKQVFEETGQKLSQKLVELSNEIMGHVEEKLDVKEEYLTKRLLDISNKQNVDWTDKMNKVNIEIQTVLDKYKIDINEIVTSNVALKLNQILIEDISIKASDKILHAFNKALVDLKQPEVDSIIEAIRGMLNKQLGVVITEKDARRPLKPIGKNELFHKNHIKLKTIIEASTRETPIVPMIVGPAGTGKSTAVEQISREMGLHFYMANRIQNTFELVGFVDASGNYVTTQFYEAFTKGGLFLFDEVDASSPEALVTINAAIAQGYMAFPGHATAIDMHPDFKVVCAGNTFGTGSTLEYTGRNKLDAATLDRFMIVEWDYDTELENKLVKDKELLNYCWKLRSESAKIDKSIIVSTRGILTMEKIFEHNKKTKAFKNEDIFKQKFFETTKKDHLKKIVEGVAQTMNKNPYHQYLEILSR